MDETTNRPDDEDAEDRVRFRATEDDSKGHRRVVADVTDDDEDETEGHVRPMAGRGGTDDDDVQGHFKQRFGLNPDEGGESHPRI